MAQAQLRDARTSELIAEGTPAEMVALAEQLGREEVLFDGVGWDFEEDRSTFDPDAVLTAAQESLHGLQAVLAEEPPKNARDREALERTIAEKESVLEPARADVDKARAALGEARKKLRS